MAKLDALIAPKPRTSATSESGLMRGRVCGRTPEGVFVVVDALPRNSFGPCSGELAADVDLFAPVLVAFADDDQADPWIVAHG